PALKGALEALGKFCLLLHQQGIKVHNCSGVGDYWPGESPWITERQAEKLLNEAMKLHAKNIAYRFDVTSGDNHMATVWHEQEWQGENSTCWAEEALVVKSLPSARLIPSEG